MRNRNLTGTALAAALVLAGAAAVAFRAPALTLRYLMPTKKNQTVPPLQGFAVAPK